MKKETMAMRTVPVSRLHELFVLTDDGRLLYKCDRKGVKGKVGKEAGWARPFGYRGVAIDGPKYLTHRVIFAMHNGYWASGEIDHADGNPANNRVSNLREATRTQQLANTRTRSDNSSGQKGVSWDASRKKWVAQISKQGKHVHLGRFSSFEDARDRYADAAREAYGEFAKW